MDESGSVEHVLSQASANARREEGETVEEADSGTGGAGEINSRTEF